MSGLTQPVAGAQSSRGSADQNPPAGFTLRPYQVAALQAVDYQLDVARVRSTLVVQATGTGKTVEFAYVARNDVSRGGRDLILVHRDELIRQSRRKCEALGLWPDVEKGKQRASLLAKVVLASVQSLRGKRLARYPRNHFTRVIVDEAHHAAAKSYQDILAHFDTAQVVGFTATPLRADGKSLGKDAGFESVAFTYDIRQAIADQYLVPIVARRVVVESVDLRNVGVRAGDFATDELAEVMADERALRGTAIPMLELARDRLGIAFCVNVKHAEQLARVLNQYRPGCARAVSGETDDDERERILAAHAAREFQFLTNCDLLVEGYDSPDISFVANCRPTKSWARYVQQGGRGLRLLGETYAESVARGKVDCLLADFSGTAGKHALIGPADCLRGADEELPDDVRAEIERQLESAQLEIGKVVAHAARAVAQRRESMRVQAVVQWHAERIDPFIGRDDKPSNMPHRPEWRDQRATQPQLDALAEEGINVEKMPALTRAEAWDLLVRIKGRRRAGLCSYKAAKKLAQAGVRDTTNLAHERAKELLDRLRLGGWRPSAIAGEPETLPEYATPAQRSFLSEEDVA